MTRQDLLKKFECYISREHGFQFGAVAMLDILGFKGTWQKHPPGKIIERLGKLANQADEEVRAMSGWYGPMKGVSFQVRHLVFSDTIIFFSTADPNSWVRYEREEGKTDEENDTRLIFSYYDWMAINSIALRACVRAAGRVIAGGLGEDLCFSYRGAISVGEYWCDEDRPYYIGPAVDECGEYFECADGAFTCLTPKSMEFYKLFAVTTEWMGRVMANSDLDVTSDLMAVLLIPELKAFNIPLSPKRGGGNLETMVVNPLCHWRRGDWEEVVERSLATFTGGESIIRKRANTAKFLEKAKEECLSADEFQDGMTLLRMSPA